MHQANVIEYSICVIDHTRKAIYLEYNNLVDFEGIITSGVNYLVGDQNLSLVNATIKISHLKPKHLKTAIRQNYRIYAVSDYKIKEIYPAQMPEQIDIIVSTEYRLLPIHRMTMGQFVELAITDQVPVQIYDRGVHGTCMTLSDEEETFLAECTIRNDEKFTISILAKLFLKQPFLVPRLMMYGKLSQAFEDISYSELKTLLGDQLTAFMTIIGSHENKKTIAEDLAMLDKLEQSLRRHYANDPQELAAALVRHKSMRDAILKSNAPRLVSEFAKEELVRSSCHHYIDLSDLEKRNNEDADFVNCLTIENKSIEGEFNESYFKEISSSLNSVNVLAYNILDLRDQSEAADKMLHLLREEILKTVYKSNCDAATSANYPLPRAKKWVQQDLVIAALKVLESAASAAMKYEGPFASLMLDAELRKYLLPFRVKLTTYGTSYPHYLALPNKHDHYIRRYSLKLPNGETMKWSSVLIKYIEHYNIMPSRAFLNNLAQCRIIFEQHLQALILLGDKLDNLPLINECMKILPDNTLQMLERSVDSLQIREASKNIVKEMIKHEVQMRDASKNHGADRFYSNNNYPRPFVANAAQPQAHISIEQHSQVTPADEPATAQLHGPVTGTP